VEDVGRSGKIQDLALKETVQHAGISYMCPRTSNAGNASQSLRVAQRVTRCRAYARVDPDQLLCGVYVTWP
jgi:hypothetical protein